MSARPADFLEFGMKLVRQLRAGTAQARQVLGAPGHQNLEELGRGRDPGGQHVPLCTRHVGGRSKNRAQGGIESVVEEGLDLAAVTDVLGRWRASP